MKIIDNYQKIKREIDRLDRPSARSGDVMILPAVKTRSAAEVSDVIRAGAPAVGENRIQEAQDKKPAVAEAAEWHFIGHLQRNKCRDALQLFDCIQSVDSVKLADRLQHVCDDLDRSVRVMVQINISGESTKSGVSPDRAESLCRHITDHPRLQLDGLMTIGSHTDDPAIIRRDFRRMYGLWRQLCEAQYPLRHLSMGMSHDYPIAVEEGATLVRLGSAIFGERSYG